MNDWKAVSPILVLFVVLAASLLAVYGLVQDEKADWIVPSPKDAALGFVSAMAAHRYTGAVNQLSQDLSQQVSEEDLQKLMEAVEQQHDSIQDEQEQDEQESGDTATATIQVKLGTGQEQNLQFSLVKENGLWKVATIAPLQNLAGQ